MTSQELSILTVTAASIGFLHTLLGPDHYLPFIVISKARKWSVTKTIWVTALCGAGHVLSSVILGSLGIGLGLAVSKLEVIESFRAGMASWALIAFGLLYFLWGLRYVSRNKPHRHLHGHMNGSAHMHQHVHTQEHLHVHQDTDTTNLTPWILFTIFVFGPCEPLIPILMFPAAKGDFLDVVKVTSIFGGVTITTMLGIVAIASFGISFVPMERLQRYTHVLAGAAIFLCGMAIRFLGL